MSCWYAESNLESFLCSIGETWWILLIGIVTLTTIIFILKLFWEWF
jgi:hypothetical protein